MSCACSVSIFGASLSETCKTKTVSVCLYVCVCRTVNKRQKCKRGYSKSLNVFARDTNHEPCTPWMATTGTETIHESISSMATAMGTSNKGCESATSSPILSMGWIWEPDYDPASYKFTDSRLHGCSLC